METEDTHVIGLEGIEPEPRGEEVSGGNPETEFSEGDKGEGTPEGEELNTPKKGFQKRINGLVAAKHSAIQRAERAERALEQARAPEVPLGDPPKIEDFDYKEEGAYEAALVQYEVSKALRDQKEKEKERAMESKRKANAHTFAKKVASSGLSDYGETIDSLVSSVALSPEIVEAIQQDENGPYVAYYLGKNLDKADEVAGMDPVSAAVAIGKISVTLQSNSNKVTKAPKPIKPAGGVGTGASKEYKDMSMDEIYRL